MAKPHSPRGSSSREHIACAIGILSGVSLLMLATAEPAWAQLRPTDASNSVLIDLSVIEGEFVRVLAWYDNEWGFSNRMVDTAVAMGKTL